MAASCAVLLAQRMPYWWIFIIASVSTAGAQAYPIRNPVIANAFENPCRKIVRSRMPGSEAMETCARAVVGQFGVNLVGEHHQIMPHAEGGDFFQFLPRLGRAGGIAGEIHHQHLRCAGDLLLELRGGQAEVVAARMWAPDTGTPWARVMLGL